MTNESVEWMNEWKSSGLNVEWMKISDCSEAQNFAYIYCEMDENKVMHGKIGTETPNTKVLEGL